jgi:hypothetical protein
MQATLPMQTIKAGVLYFALVFAAGFALGTVRVLLLVPRLGERAAELLETPVMLAISFVAARWVVRRLDVPPALAHRSGMGCLALALLLAVEFGLVLRIRGLTIAEYVAGLDPVSGTVYYLSLVLFALMPLLVRVRS